MPRRKPNQVVPGLNLRLRAEREKMGLSQDEFARLVGVTRVTENYYENASREPSLSYVSNFGQKGGDLMYLLFAERDDVEYVDLLDWDLFGAVWDWVQRVAVDSKGNPYPSEIRKKAFQLAYRACRSGQHRIPEEIDLTVLLGMAA